ncbi:MAG: response regulator, partial [Gammaproteobacteria bacterium]
MLKFLIADDHPLMRRGIRDLLREAFPDLDVGEAATGQEVEQLVRTGPWDLVLLDVSMPGGDGLETLVRVKRALPAVPVFVLSMHAEEQFAVRALKAGAAGYLTK